MYDSEKCKGSDVLSNALGFGYDKNKGAQIISERLWTHAPALAAQIYQEIFETLSGALQPTS
jgi:hypothetical protein